MRVRAHQTSSRTVPQGVSRPLPVVLRHCWYGLNQAFRRRLVPLDLTPDQFTVLRNLSEEPGLTQRELCVRMASDPNTVAALTARMEAEGWIERKVCTRDRRANRLRLLAPGKRKYTAARKIAQGLQDEVLGSLDGNERKALLEHLPQLAKACQAALKHSPPTSATAPRRATSR
jgi:MarR family transcriptional regulator for hemolysin